MEDRPVTSLNVSLPEPMKKFIETEVKRGGYSTPSEYVNLEGHGTDGSTILGRIYGQADGTILVQGAIIVP
jgi:hypothetical protein